MGVLPSRHRAGMLVSSRLLFHCLMISVNLTRCSAMVMEFAERLTSPLFSSTWPTGPDKISPPVSLLPGSFLELNNPNNLNDLTVKTDVSFYVKGVGQATSSTKADGSSLLFYLGTWAPDDPVQRQPLAYSVHPFVGN